MSEPTCENEFFHAFAELSTSLISDNLDRVVGAVGLRPFHRVGPVMAGRALTVRTRNGDNLAIHEALDLVRPGDVIVVDGGGDCSRALVGEIMVAIARKRGAVGLVIDGAIRDHSVISAGDFPCFARVTTHRGPYKHGPGEIDLPVSIGGMIVNPGDIVIGDADGVVAFPPAIAPGLLGSARAQAAREKATLIEIENGTYVGAYGLADKKRNEG